MAAQRFAFDTQLSDFHNLSAALLVADGHLVRLHFHRKVLDMSASHREQLQAEIQSLRNENHEFFSDSVFVGSTKKEESAYDERLERIRSLTHQLEAVNKET